MSEYWFEIDGESYRIVIVESRPDGAVVEVNGRTYQVGIRKEEVPSAPTATGTRLRSVETARSDAPVTDGTIRAPMPGGVLKMLVKPGDSVTAGEPVLVLEAMKMENEIKAPLAGRVEQVFVSVGDSVDVGDPLLLIAS